MRWRVALSSFLLITAVLIGLAFYLTRPTCIANVSCIYRTLILAGLFLAVGTTALTIFFNEQILQPVRRLMAVVRRISAGDSSARMLPQSSDEVGELTRHFNHLTEQLNHQIETLSERRRQLATILEYMADGVLIVDEDGYVRLINPAACRLLTVSEATAVGRSLAEVARHHQIIELYERCRAEGEEQVQAIEVGRTLFLQTAVTPFAEKNLTSYLVILQDLTPIRRLETVRRDFISNLSHELRTPLASLRAVVDTLQDGALEDLPAAHRFLERAQYEVDTMTQMVEELMELSRIESGQVPLRLAATAVADLILNPVERMRSQAEREQITLDISLPDDLPPVLADAERVQQVTTNLLHNAIKFTPNGGTIHIRAYRSDDGPDDSPQAVTVSIKDSGVGIPPEDLPRVFERFYKSDRARTRGRSGTGLGLSIARHIVQMHDGRIWVKSKEGKGSTFYFSLPLTP